MSFHTARYKHNWFKGTVQCRVDMGKKVGFGKGKTEKEAYKRAMKNLRRVRR